jgi:solute carrier family 35 protein C2
MCYKFIYSRLWQCNTGTLVESFTWAQFMVMVFPIGITTAIDILFSNISLQYITVTLYTITKTSVIAWTFLWALILKIEIFKIKTFALVCFICIGIALAVSSPTRISFVGLTFCLIAAGAGGLRWAVTERLVKSNEQCKNPFVCLYHIAPVSAGFMVPVGLSMDLLPFVNSRFAQEPELALNTAIIVLLGGLMAFALILVEVKLVQLTSSLTMGVLGQLKELLQIMLAVAIFKDEISPLNALGLGIALTGVGLYKWAKRTELVDSLRKQGTDERDGRNELVLDALELEGLTRAASEDAAGNTVGDTMSPSCRKKNGMRYDATANSSSSDLQNVLQNATYNSN